MQHAINRQNHLAYFGSSVGYPYLVSLDLLLLRHYLSIDTIKPSMEDNEYDEIPLVPDLLEKLENETHFTDATSPHMIDAIKQSVETVYHITSTKGSEHPSCLLELQSLVDLYEEAYQYHAAQKLLMRLEVAFSRTYGPENVFMCKVWNKLGELFYREMHYQHAEKFYQKSLDLLYFTFGKGTSNEEFIPVLKGLAQCKSQDPDSLHLSANYYRQLILTYTTQRGSEHEDTLHAINALTLVLEEDDKIDEAVTVGQESFLNCSTHLGVQHPFTQNAASTLARLKEAQGKVQEAEDMFRLAIAYSIAALGEKHAQSLFLQFTLAKLLFKIKLSSDALRIIEKILPFYETVLGGYHEEFLQVLFVKGEVLLSLDDPEAAREAFQRCFDHRCMLFTEEHPLSCQALFGIGRSFHAACGWRHRLDYLENIQQAKETLGRAYQGMQRIYSNAQDYPNVIIGLLCPDCCEIALYYAKFLQQFEFVEEADTVYSRLQDLVMFVEQELHPNQQRNVVETKSSSYKKKNGSQHYHHHHNHPLTDFVRAEVLYNLAVISERRKKNGRAVSLFEKVLRLYDDMLSSLSLQEHKNSASDGESKESVRREEEREMILALRADCEEQLHHSRTLFNLL